MTLSRQPRRGSGRHSSHPVSHAPMHAPGHSAAHHSREFTGVAIASDLPRLTNMRRHGQRKSGGFGPPPANPARRVRHRDHLRVQQGTHAMPHLSAISHPGAIPLSGDASPPRTPPIDGADQGDLQSSPSHVPDSGASAAPSKSVIAAPGGLRLRIHIVHIKGSKRRARRQRFDHSHTSTIDITVVATHTAADVIALVLDSASVVSGRRGTLSEESPPPLGNWTLSRMDGSAVTGPLKDCALITGDELVLSQTPWPGPQIRLRRADAIAQSNDASQLFSGRAAILCTALTAVCSGLLDTHLPWYILLGAAITLSIAVLVSLRTPRANLWAPLATPAALASTCTLWVMTAAPAVSALWSPSNAVRLHHPVSLVELVQISCGFAGFSPGESRELPAGMVTVLNDAAVAAGGGSLALLRSSAEVSRAIYTLTWASLALGSLACLVFLGAVWAVNTSTHRKRTLSSPLGPPLVGLGVFFALTSAVFLPATALHLPVVTVASLIVAAGVIAYASVSRWAVATAGSNEDVPVSAVHRIHSALMGASVGASVLGAVLICSAVISLTRPSAAATVRLGFELISLVGSPASPDTEHSVGSLLQAAGSVDTFATANASASPVYVTGVCALVTTVAALLWVASSLHFRTIIRGWLHGGTAALLLLAVLAWAQLAATVQSSTVSGWAFTLCAVGLAGALWVGIVAAAGPHSLWSLDSMNRDGSLPDTWDETGAEVSARRAQVVAIASEASEESRVSRPGMRRAVQSAELALIAAILPLVVYTSGLLAMISGVG